MCPFCFYFCMQIMLKTDMEDKKSLAGAWVEAAAQRSADCGGVFGAAGMSGGRGESGIWGELSFFEGACGKRDIV